jgi:hypothetical protein
MKLQRGGWQRRGLTTITSISAAFVHGSQPCKETAIATRPKQPDLAASSWTDVHGAFTRISARAPSAADTVGAKAIRLRDP